jgi:catalase
MKDSKKTTTTAGAPVARDRNPIPAGPRGPVLIRDPQRTGGCKKYGANGPRG